jgi:hypothetical protein
VPMLVSDLNSEEVNATLIVLLNQDYFLFFRDLQNYTIWFSNLLKLLP